jgi:UDP:flavonoid glycosyltransferase YjiC (YdhE family)
MSDRTKVLVIGEAVTLSHVVRPSVLARGLDAGRFDIVMARDPRFDHLIGPYPFRTIDIESTFPKEGLADRLAIGTPLFDADTLTTYVEEDLSLIDAEGPDLVVGDMRHSLAIATALRGVPFINISSAQWSPYAKFDSIVFNLPMRESLPEPVQDLVVGLFFPAGSAAYSHPMNVVRTRYKLPPLPLDVRHLFASGDYVVYPDLPEIISTSGMPANHRFVGPILWSPEMPLPDWWDGVPTDKPIVYVNLGSSGRHGLVETIVEGVSRLPVTVMAATASPNLAVREAEKLFVADYLPGVEAAARADLVVGNGGAMPAQQALAGGAAVLGIPSNMDQLVYARAMKRAAVGDYIEAALVTAEAVQRMAWKLLYTRPYRDEARKLAERVKGRSATGAFAGFVDEIVVKCRASATSSSS